MHKTHLSGYHGVAECGVKSPQRAPMFFDDVTRKRYPRTIEYQELMSLTPSKLEEYSMSTTEEKIAVMQASVDGKEIQVGNKGNAKDWATTPTQIWNWDNFVYRVKPQPREYYVVLSQGGSVHMTCNTLQGATDCKKLYGEREYTIVHVREVVED